jgi:hypothetical protein
VEPFCIPATPNLCGPNPYNVSFDISFQLLRLERQIPCNIMHLVTGDSGTALCEVELIGSSDARRRI